MSLAQQLLAPPPLDARQGWETATCKRATGAWTVDGESCWVIRASDTLFDGFIGDEAGRDAVASVTGRYWSTSSKEMIFRQEPSSARNCKQLYLWLNTSGVWILSTHECLSDTTVAIVRGSERSGPTGVVELPSWQAGRAPWWSHAEFGCMSLPSFYEEALGAAHRTIKDPPPMTQLDVVELTNA